VKAIAPYFTTILLLSFHRLINRYTTLFDIDFNSHPRSQMSDYFWFDALKHSIRKNKRARENRYFQLATLSQDGSPSNRTVVFRGFVDGSVSIKAITDTRSNKFAEIESNALCEVCWYFSITREQFRIKAAAAIDHQASSQERLNVWSELSASAREQFFWAAPGEPLLSRDVHQCIPPQPIQEPPASFALLVLSPIFVDHLTLKGTPQTRWYSDKSEDGWSTVAVNP